MCGKYFDMLSKGALISIKCFEKVGKIVHTIFKKANCQIFTLIYEDLEEFWQGSCDQCSSG